MPDGLIPAFIRHSSSSVTHIEGHFPAKYGRGKGKPRLSDIQKAAWASDTSVLDDTDVPRNNRIGIDPNGRAVITIILCRIIQVETVI